MSNRLKLFRERMAAFEGAANPSKALDSGYYVHTPGKLLVDTISGRVALRPFSSHLLLGGIGSGKTTQLLVALGQINEIEDTYAHYIDVSLHTDISQISNGVLIAIAGLELAKLMQDSNDEKVKASINLIKKTAFGYREEVLTSQLNRISNSLSSLTTIDRPGIVTGESIKSPLIEAVSELAKETSKKYGNIVFLFDGLDRLDNAKTFMQLVSSDAKYISSAGIGLVLVGPSIALYSDYRDTVESSLDYFYHQPFFDVENDLEAYSLFEKIIQTRTSQDFIEKPAIAALIRFSGGVLRDFITLTQASIEETYLSGEDKVQETHVLNAVDAFGRSQLRGLSDEALKIVKQTLNEKIFIPRTDEDVRLLIRRLILEYRYPKFRYAVHPAIKPLIEQISF
ncbi:MAG: hypothetical protein ACFKPT_28745 [Gloeotrichia echinulata GP01]